jgi:hypothetical protein
VVSPAGWWTPQPAQSASQSRDAEKQIQLLGDRHGEVIIVQPVATKKISSGGKQVDFLTF